MERTKPEKKKEKSIYQLDIADGCCWEKSDADSPGIITRQWADRFVGVNLLVDSAPELQSVIPADVLEFPCTPANAISGRYYP